MKWESNSGHPVAKAAPILFPVCKPKIAADFISNAPKRSAMASARTSMLRGTGKGPDSPKPSVSGAITRWCVARCGIRFKKDRDDLGVACSSTSGGPWPTSR